MAHRLGARQLFWFLQITVEGSSLRTTETQGAMGTEGYRYFYLHIPIASACNINHHSASSEQSCQDQIPILVNGNDLISVLRTTTACPLNPLLCRFPLCASIFGLILINLYLCTENTFNWYWDGAKSDIFSCWTLSWLSFDKMAVVHLTFHPTADFYAQGLNWVFSRHFLDIVMPEYLENYCNGGNVTCSGEPGCLFNGTKRMDEEKFTWRFLFQKQGKRLHRCSACVLPASASSFRVFLFCVSALPWCPLGIKEVEGCKVISILY